MTQNSLQNYLALPSLLLKYNLCLSDGLFLVFLLLFLLVNIHFNIHFKKEKCPSSFNNYTT